MAAQGSVQVEKHHQALAGRVRRGIVLALRVKVEFSPYTLGNQGLDDIRRLRVARNALMLSGKDVFGPSLAPDGRCWMGRASQPPRLRPQPAVLGPGNGTRGLW